MSIDELAQAFHETYERLAPEFGYSTRRSTAVPWDDVPEANKALMQATVEQVVGDRIRTLEAEVEELGEAIQREHLRQREAAITDPHEPTFRGCRHPLCRQAFIEDDQEVQT